MITNYFNIIKINQQHMTSSIFILTLSIIILKYNCQLNVDRLKIVDRNEELANYLVRGNLPIDQDRKFEMGKLRTELSTLTGLQDYDLIVVSFLNFLTAKQTKNRYIQEKYFDKYPEQGQYRTKLILGSLIDPKYFHQSISKSLVLLSSLLDIDQIEQLITGLHSQLQNGKKKIVFIHCSAGMDRTGYVAGSYKLKYLNYSLKQVLQQNSKFGGNRKEMHTPFLNGLKWYCFSHKQKEVCN